MASIKERVVNVIVEQLGNVKPSQLKDDTELSSLDADSLDLVELIMELEEEFDDNERKVPFKISDDDVDKIKTIGDIVACVERNLEKEE